MKFILSIVAVWLSSQAIGQTISSIQNGNWEDPNTWSGGVVPTSSNSSLINVLNQVIVTNVVYNSSNPLLIDQTVIGNGGLLTINSGGYVTIVNGTGTDLTFSGTGQINVSGQLKFSNGITYAGNTTSNLNYLSGSTYEHSFTSATAALPAASYSTSSTILINGLTAGGAFPASWAVPLGNVTVDCPSLGGGSADFAGTVANIAGNLSIQNTGATGRVYFNQSGTSTVANLSSITIGGSLSVSGVSRIFLTNTGNAEVYVAGGFSFAPSTTNNSGSVVGSGGIGLLQVGGTTSISGASWSFSSGLNGSGTFNLKGNFTASTLLTETGGGTSNGTINLIGTSTQTVNTSGATSNTINFTLNNSSGAIFTSNLTIAAGANLTLTTGDLALSSVNLSLNGGLSQSSGSISATGTSSLLIAGSGSLPASLPIGPGSVFNTFQLNRASSVLTIPSNFGVSSSLQLYSGSLVNNGTITMSNGSLVDVKAGVLSNPLTAASGGSYNIQYNNSVALSTGPELPSGSTDLLNLTKLGAGALTVTKSVTINGDFTISAGSVTDAGVARTITLLGNYVGNGVGTWSASTFNFNGSGKTISGTKTLTFQVLNFNGGTSISTSFRINGNLTVNGVDVSANAGTITFGGATTISIVNPGTLNLFTISVLASSTLTAPSVMGVGGNLTLSGTSTFNSNSGTINFNGNSSVNAASKSFNNITVTTGSTLTSVGVITVTGNIVNNSNLTFTAGSLIVNGNSTLSGSGSTQLKALTINSTFSLTANAGFNISGAITSNGNLNCSTGTTVTMNGVVALSGSGTSTFHSINITGAGSFTTNKIYTVNGNFTIDGLLNKGLSTVIFGGTSPSTVSGAGSATFNKITINASPSGMNVTMPIVIANTPFTNNGTFTSTSSTTFSLAGTTLISGSGTLNFGSVIINTGSTLNSSASYSVSGDLTVNGILLAGVGSFTTTFNGTTSITGSGTLKFNNIVVQSGKSATGTMSAVVSGNITNAGSFALTAGTLSLTANSILSGAGSTQFAGLTINSTFTFTANSGFSVSGNLGGNGNLTCGSATTATFDGTTLLSGLGTRTFGSISIANGSSLSSSVPYTVAGNYTLNGTLLQGSSTTTFVGTSPSVISGTGSGTFNILVVNAAPSGISASVPLTIAGTTFTNNSSFSNSSSTTFSVPGTVSITGAGSLSFGALQINNGTTLSTNQNYSVSGNLSLDGVLNAGTSNTATFNGTTTIASINNLATPSISFNNVSITGSVAGYSGNVNVNGNFTFGNALATYQGNGGTVTFTAQALTHTISGAGSATFNNININHGTASPDLTFASNQKLAGVMTLGANAIVNSGGFLTLLSTNDNPATDASIASIPGGADVQGDVTIQRYMSAEPPTPAQGIYRYLSAPITNATVSQWQASFSITGAFTGRSTTDPSTGTSKVCNITMKPANASMFYWNETTQAYVAYPTTTSAAPLVQGNGYSAFVRNCTTATIASVKGPIYNASTTPFNFSSLLTYTGSGSNASLVGWNLVGNPFPSAIDWGSASGWSKSGISPVIAVTDNGGTGNGTLIYLDASTGAGKYIASGQGFWVRTTGAGATLTASESVKATGSYQFYRQANPAIDNLEISVVNGVLSDKAYYKLNNSSVSSLDNFDGPKLDNAWLNLSTLSADQYKMAINSSNELACGSTIQIDIATPGVDPATKSHYTIMPDGNYQLNFAMSGLFKSYALIIHDLYKGTSQNISQNPVYSFTANGDQKGSNSSSRFYLSLSEESFTLNNNITPELKACGDAVLSVDNTSAEMTYYATIHSKIVSNKVTGTSSSINLTIPAKFLSSDVDTVVYYAMGKCNTYQLNHVSIVKHDGLYVSKAESITKCGIGSASITATGAPAGGNYNWYTSVDSTVPVYTGKSYTTPELSKSEPYFVAAVNTLGCEGERAKVQVSVVNMAPASVIVLNDLLTLQSSYQSGNQWYEDGEIILGATSQKYTPTRSGAYTVKVTSAGCSVSSDPLLYIKSDNDPSQTEIKFYPNPTDGIVNFETKVQVESSAQVIDNLGQTIGVLSMSGLQDGTYKGSYDFTNHPTGLYFVRMNAINRNSPLSFKIIRK